MKVFTRFSTETGTVPTNLKKLAKPQIYWGKVKYAIMALFMVASFGASAQWSITTSGVSSQNFDGMGTSATATLPAGFRVNTGTDWSTGTSSTGAAAGTSGTGALTGTSGGNIYNFANGVTGSSTDRALGFLTSGSFTSPRNTILRITNNTGNTITAITVSFDYEKYRTGTRAWNMNFFHGSTSTPATAATDGDQAYAADGANAVVNPPTTISKSVTLTGLSIANGSDYYFRWAYAGTGGSTNSQGIGIDNVSLNVTAGPQNQTITWSQTISPATYGQVDLLLSATASSNLTVSYSSDNTSVATITGGNLLQIVGAGTANITASQAGNGSYNPATDVVKALTVNKANQTITFDPLPNKQLSDPDFTLDASASSNLTVSYTSSNTSVATVTGNLVHIVGPGTTTFTASQAGDANYNPATDVTQDQFVANVLTPQTINWTQSISPKTYGDAAFTLNGTATSGLTVTYSSSNTDVATVSGNTVTIVGVGSTTITADQAGNGTYAPADPVAQSLTVNTKELSVSGATVDTKAYDGNTDANISNATLVGVVGSDDVTISGTSGTFADANAGTGISVTTNLTLGGADASNYTLAQPTGLTGNINKADQTITFTGPLADKMVGEANFNVSASASSGLAVTFSSTNPSVATVTSGGLVHIVAVGSTFIVASQAGDGNYNPATDVQLEQIITPLAPVSLWTNPITGTSPGNSNPYTTGQTVAAGITVSGIGRSGLNANTANNRYNASNWSTAGSIDDTKYFEWTITPDPGNAIKFSSLVYNGQASGTGPTSFAIRSSLDGFTSNIATPGAAGGTISLAAAQFQSVASAITFRLYGWNASSTGGTASVDDFTFNGNIQAAPPVVTYTVLDESFCAVTPDGAISTSVTGVGPFTYSWTGTSGSGAGTPFTAGNVANLTNIQYGYYNLSVTDGNGTTVTIPNIHVKKLAAAPYITHTGEASSSCGNTGTLTIFAQNGVPPYTYSVDGTNYQSSNNFTGLAAGPMTMYVQDSRGCIGTKNYTILAAPTLTVSTYLIAASACAADGGVKINRTGGIAPYTYSIDGTNYVSTNLFTGLTGNGTYTAYVKDSKGCIASAEIVIPQGSGLTVTERHANTTSCINNGSIQVIVTGGYGPYTYSLDGNNFQSSNSFTDLPEGNYVVTVNDSRGCSGTVNVTINTVQIVITAVVTPASSCEATNGSIKLLRSGGGVGPFTFSIDGDTYQSSNVFTNLPAGYYNGYAKDANTCIGELIDILVGPSECARFANSRVSKSDVTVQAFPNPSANEFTLNLNGFNRNEKVAVIVTDMMGRKVAQIETIANQQLRIGKQLQSGTYHVQLVQGAVRKTVTLVKE